MRVSVWYFSVTYVSLFLTALSPPAFLIWLWRLRMMWDSKWVPGAVPDTVKVMITQVLESFTDSICCTKKQAQEGPVTCLGCKKLSNNPSSNLLATSVLSSTESLLAFSTISTAGVGCGHILRYQDTEGGGLRSLRTFYCVNCRRGLPHNEGACSMVAGVGR